MSSPAEIYLAEMLRAAFGPKWRETKVADLHRLTQYAERLAETEQAHSILRHKGYGHAGMSLVDLAKAMPENVRGMLRGLFKRAPATDRPDQGDIFDIWTTR